MPKAKGKSRRQKFGYNANQKRLNRNARWKAAPRIECSHIRHAWDHTKSVRQNLAEMGLAMDPNKAVPLRKRKKLEQSKSKTREISKRDLVLAETWSSPRLGPRKSQVLFRGARLCGGEDCCLASSASVPFGGQVSFVAGVLDLYGSAKLLRHSAIMNPEDPCNGFRHSKVLMFINEQMSKHKKGPEFYSENLGLSWEEVEEKLRILLEDSEMPSQAREACAWGSLALGVRFAWRQGQLQGRRVQCLHDLAIVHRSAAYALASDLKKLTAQQEMERKEVAFQLQLAHTKLAEVQRERDLLKLKLLYAELRAFPVAEMPVMTRALATAGEAKTETQNADKKEEVRAVHEPEKEMEGATAMAASGELAGTGKLEGITLDRFGAVEWKNYAFGLKGEGGEGEGEDKSMEKPTCSDSEPLDLSRSTSSLQPVTIQLPDSFTYSYESPFSVSPTPSPPISIVPEPQMPPYFMATDMNMSETEGPTVYLQELPKDSQNSQLQGNMALHRPGDWDCPWCKTVKLSEKENCFRCGKLSWLRSPQ